MNEFLKKNRKEYEIRRCLLNYLNKDSEVNLWSNFKLEINTYEFNRLIIFVQEYYSIIINNNESMKVKYFDDLIELIKRKLHMVQYDG